MLEPSPTPTPSPRPCHWQKTAPRGNICPAVLACFQARKVYDALGMVLMVETEGKYTEEVLVVLTLHLSPVKVPTSKNTALVFPLHFLCSLFSPLVIPVALESLASTWCEKIRQASVRGRIYCAHWVTNTVQGKDSLKTKHIQPIILILSRCIATQS